MFSQRFWAGSALLATFAVLGVGCSGCNGGGTSGSSTTGGTAANGEIRIGSVAALNGNLRPWGVDSRDGSQLAVDEFNKAGGLNGQQVKLFVQDSNSKPETGKSATEELIATDKCIVILGEVSSGITAQMKAATTEHKVPQIAVGATKTDLTEGTNYLVRVCYTDKLQGPVMAKFAYDELKLRNIALMTDEKQPYSTGLSKAFADFFKQLGGTIVDEEKYNSDDTQFSAQLTNVKAKNPDGVFCSGYFPEVGPIVRQAREAGIGKNVKFLGGDGWDSRDILTSGGDAIVGSYFCNHYNNKDPNPAVQTFLQKWAAAHGGSLPGTTMGALGYDAANVALDAMKRAKSLSTEDVNTAIQNTENYHGVSGDITLKGWHGNPPKRAIVVQLTSDPQNPQDFAKAYDYFDLFPSERPGAAPAASAASKPPAKK